MSKKITVALAGNPNSGKTTVFNNLTGAHQHVGNYPGVTVEKKAGHRQYGGLDIKIIDLPGTYSLTAYSIEEMVARNFIIEDKPDIVVDIIDASNLERNLYLATQLMELNVPLILVFNMSDIARQRGIEFDLPYLSELLGTPIVPMVAQKNKGTRELLEAITSLAYSENLYRPAKIPYGREIEKELEKIQTLIEQKNIGNKKYNPRWLAVKLLEDDQEVKDRVNDAEISETVQKGIERLEKIFGDHPEIVISDKRYGFISGACQETVRGTVQSRHTTSDLVDAVVTNRILGFPIFFGLMYLVFHLTFTLGEPPMRWIEQLFSWLANNLALLWPAGSGSPLRSLLIDGIISGVGGVIVFLPNILLLFLAIALLEDSGYMARAAFIMDRLMHKIGLHGKSFIPMLIGFGCSVPAIMATRMLDNRRDRLTTMLVIPLMSCGARLPIYALIIPAFFPSAWHGPMLWIIYMIGIILAVIAARVLRSTIFKGLSAPFVMELPPYRIPTLKGTFIHMWERGWLYLKKAGTVILGISIVLWAMTSYPKNENLAPELRDRENRARSEYFEKVKTLGADIGFSSPSDVLLTALRAEDEKRQIQAGFHRHEDSYWQAQVNYDRYIDSLQKGVDGAWLESFLEACEAVMDARKAFEEVVAEGGYEPGSGEYSVLESNLNLTLNDIETAHAQIYGAVLTYLDSVRTPYEETLQNLRQEIQGKELAYSIAGRVGRFIEPMLKPMGFDWRIGTALIGAFAAKEVFVAQMGIVFSVGDTHEGPEALRHKLRRTYTPLVAFCVMLFTLISTPCMATVAVTKRESNSWKWALLQLSGLTVLAFVLTVLVFQIGHLLGLG
ncbi:MAG: ferrous iron transport protein B [Candidatus Zixiibacteriota bacterium]